jgi:hypothetical protein
VPAHDPEEPHRPDRPEHADRPGDDLPVTDRHSHKLFGTQLWVWEGLSYVVTVLGAFGVIFAVTQYFLAQEADRSKETLAMIEIWETRGYSKSFTDLGASVQDFLISAPKEDLQLAGKNKSAAENLRKAMYAKVLSNAASKEDFDRVVYFFNRLGLCVEASLCSSKTADIFFQDSLRGFMSNFSELIQDKRSTLPGYASGVLLLEKTF